MGAVGLLCCCGITISDMPDISITGMTTDGPWEPAGNCCFKRRFVYTATQQRQVVSADLQRIERHLEATQVLKAYQDPQTFPPTYPALFDCVTGVMEFHQYWVERIGLVYLRQSVDVFVQYTDVNCGYGPSKKYVISVRHNVGFRSSLLSASWIDQIQDFTSASCCTGTVSDVSDLDNEPDWDDVTIWPDYDGALDDGEYWHHKYFDTMPNDTAILIDGCLAPCTVANLCSAECEGICLTSEPSGTIPIVGGYAVCPTPDYIARTCTVTPGSYTKYYYGVTALGTCDRFGDRLGNMPSSVAATGCAGGPVVFSHVDTTSFVLTTECQINTGAEVCLNTPITLQFADVFIEDPDP